MPLEAAEVMPSSSDVAVSAGGRESVASSVEGMTPVMFPIKEELNLEDGMNGSSVDVSVDGQVDFSQKPPSPLLPPKMREQFVKTKICPHHARGHCMHGKECTYAHAKEELRPLPDLQKTKLCESVTRGFPCRAPNCTYAHSRDELRATRDLVAYKTSLCFFHKKERCLNGDKCRFAHGVVEIRLKPQCSDVSFTSEASRTSLSRPARDIQETCAQGSRHSEVSNRHSGRMGPSLTTGGIPNLADRRAPRIVPHASAHHSVRNVVPHREIVPALPLAEVPYNRNFHLLASQHPPMPNLSQQSPSSYNRRLHHDADASHPKAATARGYRRGERDTHKLPSQATFDEAGVPCVQPAEEKIEQGARWSYSAGVSPSGSWGCKIGQQGSNPLTPSNAEGKANASWGGSFDDKGITDAETTDVTATPSSSCNNATPREHSEAHDSSGGEELDRIRRVGPNTQGTGPLNLSDAARMKAESLKDGTPGGKPCTTTDSSAKQTPEGRLDARKSRSRRSKFMSVQSCGNLRYTGLPNNRRRPEGGSQYRVTQGCGSHTNGGRVVQSGWPVDVEALPRPLYHRSVSYHPSSGLNDGIVPNCPPQTVPPYTGLSCTTDGDVHNPRLQVPIFPPRMSYGGPDGSEWSHHLKMVTDNAAGDLMPPARGSFRETKARTTSNEQRPQRNSLPQFSHQRAMPDYPLSNVCSGQNHNRYSQPRLLPRYHAYPPTSTPSRASQEKANRIIRGPQPVVLHEANYPAALPSGYSKWDGCPEVPRSTPIALPEVPIEELTAGQPDHYED